MFEVIILQLIFQEIIFMLNSDTLVFTSLPEKKYCAHFQKHGSVASYL